MKMYQLLLMVLTPIIWLRLLKFCQHNNYRLKQAFGIHKTSLEVDIWLHCASVGEVMAVRGFLDAWQAKHPQQRVLITTMTPTGAAQVKKVFGKRVSHRYLPIDWQGSVRRFLKQLTAKKLLIVETELWPNLLVQAKQKQIDIYILNARMSARSFEKYAKYPRFSQKIMSIPDQFCAHSHADAERFQKLGAQSVVVTGNIKFDVVVDEKVLRSNWRNYLADKLLVWVAASTHAKEEELLLMQHRALQTEYPNTLMVLVPRHPERFDFVYKLACQRFQKVGRRSDTPIEDWHTLDVLIGDSMGEMMYYFQASDIVFMAGSLIKRGGHNPIEPALLAKPILVGEYTFNFADITEGIIQAGGGIRCKHVEVVSKLLIAYINDTGALRETGRAAQEFVKQNQGAVERLLDQVDVENSYQ
ncbi:3-deoxy-D-manno-octulosonic acid transferase [Marinomonas agarivorans]|nr:3-deoxy-D-manno-octulosonic acid transferase [Marinomonas agarivorans]